MSQSWKNEFNELAALKTAYDAVAVQIKPVLSGSPEALDALVNHPHAESYDSADHARLMRVEKDGAEAYGYEAASHAYLKFLKSADYNLGIVLPFLKAAHPVVAGAGRVRALAAKYNLVNIQKLLP